MRGARRAGPSWAAVALLVVLAVPAVVLVVAEPSRAATARTLAITSAMAKPTVPFGNFDGNPPKVFDIDGDGDLEIIAQNDNQWVYVFDSRTGRILAELKTVFPSGWGARSMNGPEVAVLTGDGKVHLVVANSAATITSYTYDPVGSTGLHFAFKKDWQRRLNDCYSSPGMDSKPVLHDLDKDGRLDILAATEESGIYALRHDGSLLWKKCIGGGNAEPGVTDLNRDGWPDVVFGSDGAVVTAMNGRTGATMWSFWALGRFDLRSGSIPVGPGLGQLDGVGGPDVVVGLRDSHNTTDYEQDHALLLALDSGGRVLWAKQDSQGNPLTYTHPVVVDADRDGTNEVYWADWNTIGHKGGIPEKDWWTTTGPANFYRYDNRGNLLWRQSLPTFWNNKDIALADVDGDGTQEVLANGPGANGNDGVWYLNGDTGAKEAWIDLYPWKLSRGPVVADLHGDGMMHWVAQAGAATSTVSGGAILVYSTGVRYNAAWPHLPYPGQGTASPTPTATSSTTATTTTATGGPGDFAASFLVPPGANEWWVEVQVSANEPLSGVCAQVNGGTCVPLAKQSWGNWARSFHVPAGSAVVFRATSGAGETVLSQTMSWLSGSTGFSASFTPKAVGNDWWVEADVGATKALAGVDARINSGPWVGLAKQSWGSWAKSLNAPNGSTVTFRAVSVDGEAVASKAYTWT